MAKEWWDLATLMAPLVWVEFSKLRCYKEKELI